MTMVSPAAPAVRASVRARRGFELFGERRAARLRVGGMDQLRMPHPSAKQPCIAIAGRLSEGWVFAIVSGSRVSVNRALRNPFFANRPAAGRDPAAQLLARSTFHGRFFDPGWRRHHHHRDRQNLNNFRHVSSRNK